MIRNKTKRFVIIEKTRFCRSFLSKGIGLTLHKKPDYGLVFVFGKPSRVSLTMFLVFFPIDVLYLDEKRRVVEIKKGFLPFTNYTPRNKAQYIVEFPVGHIKNTGIGDSIEIAGL
jgi:uncharacterized protein